VFSDAAILRNKKGRAIQGQQAPELAAYALEVTGNEMPIAIVPPPAPLVCFRVAICGRVATAERLLEGGWHPVCEKHVKGAKKLERRALAGDE
jgi:hypothetical protein